MTVDWELDNLGVVVKDINETLNNYRRLSWEIPETPAKEVLDGPNGQTKSIYCFVQNSALRIKLIQPETGIFKDYLDKYDEGVNFMAFVVKDLQKEKATLVKAGFPVMATQKKADGSDFEVFFDTRKYGNAVIALFSEPAPFPLFKPQPGNLRFWHVGFWTQDINKFVEYYQKIGFRLLAKPHLGHPSQTVMNRWIRYDENSGWGKVPKAGAIHAWMVHLQNASGTFLFSANANEGGGTGGHGNAAAGEAINHLHFQANKLPEEMVHMVMNGFPCISTQKHPSGRVQESFYSTKGLGIRMGIWGGVPSVKAFTKDSTPEQEAKVYAYYDATEREK